MDALAQFVREQAIDETLAFDPRLAREGGGFHSDIKMGLSAAIGVVAGMPMVPRRIVLYLQTARRKRALDFFPNAVAVGAHVTHHAESVLSLAGRF